jgi:predicted nucleic acid-binding protein
VATSTELPRALVVDASVCLPWILIDEASADSERLLLELPRLTLWAPPLWRLEMANAVVIGERRKRVRAEFRDEMIEALERLPVRIDETPAGLARTVDLAARHGLTVYDAAYLELALRRKLPLATLDDALRRAAPAVGVNLFEV